MRFADLSERLSADPKHIREWVRGGVVLPVSAPSGRGRPNDYDDASLLAAAVAQVLEGLNITVAHYVKAFAELHDALRARSSLEWSHFQLQMTPDSARLIPPDADLGSVNAAVRIDLFRLCASLMLNDRQQVLGFGLRAL